MACKGAKHAKALAEASRVSAVGPKTKTAEEAVRYFLTLAKNLQVRII